jgi:fibro-slime domain-containing protein
MRYLYAQDKLIVFRRAVAQLGLALALSSLAHTVCTAQSFDVTARIRDFRARGTPGGHPDFQWYIPGVVTGLVRDTLDGDDKPVFVGTPGAGAITDASTFEQWYRDVPGVNLGTNITLSFTYDNINQKWVYSNSAFFPIDNQLFGNQGNSHNYHFTMEIATTIYYDSSNPNIFTFAGDDDIWVFINRRLVVDIGGVHSAASQTIDLNALASSLGLVSGNRYPLHIFWAERHLVESVVQIETTEFIPEPSSYLALASGLVCLARLRRGRGRVKAH